jgi:hypothetical protein
MGFSTSIVQQPDETAWSVLVKVNLTRAESNQLFLSGDSMIAWPAEGMRPAAPDHPRPERSGMFVSEMASRPRGLTISYRERGQAERAAVLLRAQLAQIGIEEES